MSDLKSKAAARLSRITNTFSSASTALVRSVVVSRSADVLPWHPDETALPTRKNLPKIEGAPDQAAWVWGKDDFIGRLNLLTPARVTAAAAEVQSGDIVPVNLALDEPNPPVLGREPFKHEIKTLEDGWIYDDIYHMNTQSGTQWDGFRHFAHRPSKLFYNFTTGADIVGPHANDKCSIHHWAVHGIAGRGLLLDVWGYCQSRGMAYDPLSRHQIPYSLLVDVGRAQGIDIRPTAQGGDIRPGDMLFVRGGWRAVYATKTPAEREQLSKAQRFAGLAQEEPMLDWLHDAYFAAVAGDSPTFEAWPPKRGSYFLHEYILALWGMPLGEMLDLERLALTCRVKGRWFFFFSSTPANCPRGVSSHVNGQAIF